MADKNGTVAITITTADKDVLASLRRLEAQTKRVGETASRANDKFRQLRLGMAKGVVSGGSSFVQRAAGMAGIVGFGALMKQTRDFEATITDIGITGNLSNEQLSKLRGKVMDVSNQFGKSKEDVVGFVKEIVTLTGDASLATDNLETMGKVSLATGTSMTGLAGVMAKLATNMKIPAQDMYKTFNALRTQSKLGSVEMNDLSRYIGSTTGIASLYGEKGRGYQGAKDVGALYQIAGRGKSTEQIGDVSTSVNRMLSSFFTKFMKDRSGVAYKMGFKESDVGQMGAKGFEFKSLATIARVIARSMQTDKGKAQASSIFGEFGVQAAYQLMEAERAGWHQNAGMLFDPGDEDVLSQDAKRREDSPAAKWDKAIVQVSNSMHEAMLPAMEKIAENATEIADVFKFLIENTTELFALWLGFKGARFFGQFTNLASMRFGGGAGGIPGGGGALAGVMGVLGKVAIAGQIASVVTATIPLAMSLYKKAQGYTEAGGEIGKVQKRAMTALERSTVDSAFADQSWRISTLAGSKTYKKSQELMAKLGYGKDADLSKVETYRKGKVSLEDIMKDPKKAGGLMGELKEQYGATAAIVRDRLEKQQRANLPEGAEVNVTKTMIEQAAPELVIMRKTAEALDRALAQLNMGLKVDSTVHVDVSGNDPGGRVAAAVAAATLASSEALKVAQLAGRVLPYMKSGQQFFKPGGYESGSTAGGGMSGVGK